MRRASSATAKGTALLYKVTSILLQHPDKPVWAALHDISAATPAIRDAAARRHIECFLNWITTTPAIEVASHYVATFDHTSRRALHLTYYRHGDTRARGMALLALKHTYRAAGYEPPPGELPDYLPLMLEFAALAPEGGRRVLIQCQAGFELLRQALHDSHTPYGLLMDAIRTQLPAMRRRDRDDLRALAHTRTPTENVGLEPFAPPEFLTGEHQ